MSDKLTVFTAGSEHYQFIWYRWVRVRANSNYNCTWQFIHCRYALCNIKQL